MTPEDSETPPGPAAAPEMGRIFLVVIDDTDELKPALEYACLRAKRSNGRVAMLYVIPPVEFEHFMFVGDVMREDRRKDAEALLQSYADRIHEISGKMPIIHLREGDRREELLKFLDTETVHVLVLGADTGKGGPGPLISSLMGKDLRRVHVPITIIPGVLNSEEIRTLTLY
ncbi:Universal stress protein UspA and related nucleotide-binding protein [uncultured Alphaproteobacteria bacterium]|jgi:nucleotide-binding universal stress UspA family protein|uniref:Universal stress protein UspA and related nucleotide-binding protein n=1 Tax=uncultured Alphaproteobacteria bacterium TaxID=91750 RepID=A0A212KMC0_9PROT|nr:Universal stress protein UspA and related nucleotide-binding protein [uncultured Alphaproteobacteria bacterium]